MRNYVSKQRKPSEEREQLNPSLGGVYARCPEEAYHLCCQPAALSDSHSQDGLAHSFLLGCSKVTSWVHQHHRLQGGDWAVGPTSVLTQLSRDEELFPTPRVGRPLWGLLLASSPQCCIWSKLPGEVH